MVDIVMMVSVIVTPAGMARLVWGRVRRMMAIALIVCLTDVASVSKRTLA